MMIALAHEVEQSRRAERQWVERRTRHALIARQMLGMFAEFGGSRPAPRPELAGGTNETPENVGRVG